MHRKYHIIFLLIWVTLQAPFRTFYHAYGDDTRHNDDRLDVSKIMAYALHVISTTEVSMA